MKTKLIINKDSEVRIALGFQWAIKSSVNEVLPAWRGEGFSRKVCGNKLMLALEATEEIFYLIEIYLTLSLKRVTGPIYAFESLFL